MAKIGGGDFAVFLVDGYDLLPSLSEACSITKESITQETNAFSSASIENTPVGLSKGTLSIGDGFFDAVADAIHAAFGSLSHVSRTVCAGIEGNVIGKHFVGFEGMYDQKYDVKDTRDGITKANVTYQVTGDVDEGIIVQSLAAFTADQIPPTGDTPVDWTLDNTNRSINILSNTIANPSVVTTQKNHGLTTGDIILIAGVATSSPTINGSRTVTVLSPTTFSVPINVTVAGTGGSFVRVTTRLGGIGYLHATALTGFTGVVAKIVHSADDSTYATLITFATLTLPNSKERKVVAASNVDRYLSSSVDVTGSGSVSLFMGFARN